MQKVVHAVELCYQQYQFILTYIMSVTFEIVKASGAIDRLIGLSESIL